MIPTVQFSPAPVLRTGDQVEIELPEEILANLDNPTSAELNRTRGVILSFDMQMNPVTGNDSIAAEIELTPPVTLSDGQFYDTIVCDAEWLTLVTSCQHEFVDHGCVNTWCKKCNADGYWKMGKAYPK